MNDTAYKTTNGQQYVSQYYGKTVLDNNYPYEPSPDNPGNAHPGNAPGYSFSANEVMIDDTPDLLLQAGDTAKGTFDLFQMYLMFLPPGTDSRFVPLKVITWYWMVDAVKTNGIWSIVPNSDDADSFDADETHIHPEWADYWKNAWVPKN